MGEKPNQPTPVSSITVPVRVRYAECDPMNVAHHAAYAVWLEIARTELLRQSGRSYREVEESGLLFVVARLTVRYRRPIRYDDQIDITCSAQPPAGAKIDHTYELRRGAELVATASTTIVCIDRGGRMQRVPEDLHSAAPPRA